MFFLQDEKYALIFIISSDKEKVMVCSQFKDENSWRISPNASVVTKEEIEGRDFSKSLKLKDVPKDILHELIKRSLDDELSSKLEVML